MLVVATLDVLVADVDVIKPVITSLPPVTRPLLSTVTDLYVPAVTPVFAKVKAADTFVEPLNDNDPVASPVHDNVRPVVKLSALIERVVPKISEVLTRVYGVRSVSKLIEN